MRTWWLLIAGAPVAAAFWVSGAADSVPISIRLFGYDRITGDVVAYADGPIQGKGFGLREPDRWVVDIPNAVYHGTTKLLTAVPGTGIRSIRIGQFTRSDVRVVFDLDQPLEIPVRSESRQNPGAAGHRLVFDLPSPVGTKEIMTASKAPARPRPTPEPLRRVETAAGAPAAAPMRVVEVEPPEAPPPREASPSLPGSLGWLADLVGGSHAPGGPPLWPFGSQDAAPYSDPHANDLDSEGEEPKPVPVSGLTLRRAGKGWIMRLTADRPIDYKLARLGRRDRVFVDLIGGSVDIPRESMYVDNGLMARVRKGAMQDGATRVVLELDQPLRYEAHLSADKRAVILALSRSEPHDIPGVGDDRITIDPGHGGGDPGTIGPAGTYEKAVNLAVATRLSDLLARAGMDVQLTRSRDTDLLLWPRVDMGDEFKSAAFVSIHMNSAPNRHTQGIETYYFTPESIPLAKSVHRKLVAALGQPDRGVRRANFVVVKYSRMPACLVEVGYLSNAREEALLANPEYQNKAAQAIMTGLEDFLREKIARQ